MTGLGYRDKAYEVVMVGFWYRDGGKVGRSCIVNTRCMLDIAVSREAMALVSSLAHTNWALLWR